MCTDRLRSIRLHLRPAVQQADRMRRRRTNATPTEQEAAILKAAAEEVHSSAWAG